MASYELPLTPPPAPPRDRWPSARMATLRLAQRRKPARTPNRFVAARSWPVPGRPPAG